MGDTDLTTSLALASLGDGFVVPAAAHFAAARFAALAARAFAIAQSSRIEQKTLRASVGQVGVIFSDTLRHQPEPLSEGHCFRSAFRQHCRRFLSLGKVSSHGSDAGFMHLHKFRAIHSTPPSLLHIDYTMPS
jgi:hypothetical protein